MYLATAAQMQEIDRIAIEERGIGSLVLMERAAEHIARAAQRAWESRSKECGSTVPRRAAVFAGAGNNGGDGLAAARLLAQNGWEVAVLFLGRRDKMTRDNAAMADRLKEVGLEMYDYPAGEEERARLHQWCGRCAVLIEALFGVGLSRPVEGMYADAVALMNALERVDTISADIPCGISTDTGEVLGCAVRAAYTVTFSMAKIGHFTGEGAHYTGALEICDIGIPCDIIDAQCFDTQTIDGSTVRRLMPRRKADGHKGDFGKAYILSGSVGFTGAPVLAARGCSHMGAGLVTVGTPSAVYPIVAGRCLEEMVYPLPDADGRICTASREKIMEKLTTCDAVLLGPGLGRGAESDALLRDLIAQIPQPLILDADGINAAAAHIDVIHARKGRATVLTPHEGEFARIGGDVGAAGRFTAARRFAAEHGCVLVLKGARTIVAAPDGRTAINLTGNDGMAKGGSGDVLAGMILALAGQGLDIYDAACIGVWLHGRAGDLAAEEKGRYAMMPSDLIAYIGAAIRSAGTEVSNEG